VIIINSCIKNSIACLSINITIPVERVVEELSLMSLVETQSTLVIHLICASSINIRGFILEFDFRADFVAILDRLFARLYVCVRSCVHVCVCECLCAHALVHACASISLLKKIQYEELYTKY
jgi:hypothetical protein